MAWSWNNAQVASFKVKKTDAKFITLPGVNSSNEAGTPDQFVDATNRMLSTIGITVVTSSGMKRFIEQDGVYNE